MVKPSKASPPTPVVAQRHDWLGAYVGIFTVLCVSGVYGLAYSHGKEPAGHPGSGFMWMLVALMTLRTAFLKKPLPRIAYWITLGFVVVGMLIWLATTLQLLGIMFV